MTDRVKGFVVTLREDWREDDAETIAQAIRMFSGVASVVLVPSDISDHMNREMVRLELRRKLLEALK